MRIAMTGTSGTIGTALIDYFKDEGHRVTRIIRDTSLKSGENVIAWDITTGVINTERLEDHDAVIHLAGANIAAQRWTPSYKKTILKSRVDSTTILSRALAALKKPPKVFICASALGYYGSGEAKKCLDESTPKGQGYLADVCEQWEKATRPAQEAGIRVVFLRFGMVLSLKGGALKQMLPVFRCGLGGRIGKGNQVMSWVAVDEIPLIVAHILKTEINGVVNAVSPLPVTNEEFTRILGKTLHRPTFFPVPEFAVKLLFGEMGEELLLKGAKVIPGRLQETGYKFSYPDLHSALEKILKE